MYINSVFPIHICINIHRILLLAQPSPAKPAENGGNEYNKKVRYHITMITDKPLIYYQNKL